MHHVPTDPILRKLARIRRSGTASVVDLFAGCGGMSLGFQRAGFEIAAGIELEDVRARVHAENFHPGPRQELHARGRDITAASPDDLLRELTGSMFTEVDVIVGGPPCQAYARVGRAKLREIARESDAHLTDPRGMLYAAYLKWVEATRPVAVVMENVPDILRFGGINIGELIAQGLDALGYEVRYTLLNAANFGVPQTRERWYLIGVHKALRVVPHFPTPTHHFKLPVGYRGTRAEALRWDQLPVEDRPDHATPLQPAPATLREAVTCEQALSDLPVIRTLDGQGPDRGVRDLSALSAYLSLPTNPFQEDMRRWPGRTSRRGVSAHVIRTLKRDYETFARMAEGDDYPKARAVAEAIFAAKVTQRRLAGDPIPEGSAAWEALRAETVPPYDPCKFPNKWRKLERGFPSRTLMAHLSHDTYSHIHYDDEQARTISVREAARLQSFPDGFTFNCSMNAAFGMIGNAVPPLVALAIAMELRGMLGMSLAQTDPPARRAPAFVPMERSEAPAAP
jgi:DNA (cytosine-5)-methyltransferase 1